MLGTVINHFNTSGNIVEPFTMPAHNDLLLKPVDRTGHVLHEGFHHTRYNLPHIIALKVGCLKAG